VDSSCDAEISDGVARVKLWLVDELRLGNLDDERDRGYAGNYVDANVGAAAGRGRGLRIATWETHFGAGVQSSSSPVRVSTLNGTSARTRSSCARQKSPTLSATPRKARKMLGWEARHPFRELVEMTLAADLPRLAARDATRVSP
jgi:GDPmannose 4,6-dehydratase